MTLLNIKPKLPALNLDQHKSCIDYCKSFLYQVDLHEAQEVDDDEVILQVESQNSTQKELFLVLTAYKQVDKKIKPVPTSFPEDCYVCRCILEDPLLTIPPLLYHPPSFTPTQKITSEQMDILDVNGKNFL